MDEERPTNIRISDSDSDNEDFDEVINSLNTNLQNRPDHIQNFIKYILLIQVDFFLIFSQINQIMFPLTCLILSWVIYHHASKCFVFFFLLLFLLFT